MKFSDFEFSRDVANGRLYFCPECGAEMFVEKDSPFAPYCDDCGSEFDIDFGDEGE